MLRAAVQWALVESSMLVKKKIFPPRQQSESTINETWGIFMRINHKEKWLTDLKPVNFIQQSQLDLVKKKSIWFSKTETLT